MYKLSIIVPVYNEARTVQEILRRLEEAVLLPGWEKEIIVVDDASTDGTRDLLRPFEERMRVIYRTHNGGKGSAVFDGLRVSTGTHVVTQDADLEYDPNDIQHLLAPIQEGRADVVYGSRTLRPQERYGSRIASSGVWVLTKLINMLWGLTLTDVCAGYKLFPASAASLWRPGGFDSDIRLAGALAKHGYRIAEVPITYRPRAWHEGKKIRYQDGFWAIIVIMRDRLSR